MFLIDNNLSPKLARALRPIFPGTAHVVDFKLEAADDRTVWNYAKTNGFHLLTKDRDFVELIRFQGFPPKVVKLNCGNVTTQFISNLLLREEPLLKSFLASTQHGLLVLN